MSCLNLIIHFILNYTCILLHVYRYFLFFATSRNLSFAFNKMRGREGGSYIRDLVCEISACATLYSQESEIMKNRLQGK